MKLELKLLLTALLLVNLSYEAHAGTTFQTLSKDMVIIEVDKITEQTRKAREISQRTMSKERIEEIKRQSQEVLNRYASSPLEYYKWALDQLDMNIEQPELFYLNMAMLSDQIKLDGKEPPFLTKSKMNDIRLSFIAKNYGKAREIIRESQQMASSSSPISFTVLDQLKEIKRHAENNVPYQDLLEATERMIKYDREYYKLFNDMLPDYILDNETQSQALELSRKTEKIMEESDNEHRRIMYTISATLLDKHYSSESIQPEIKKLRDMKKELFKAQELSQKIMSNMEIYELLDANKNKRFVDATKIIDGIIARVSSSPVGASVQMGSITITRMRP